MHSHTSNKIKLLANAYNWNVSIRHEVVDCDEPPRIKNNLAPPLILLVYEEVTFSGDIFA